MSNKLLGGFCILIAVAVIALGFMPPPGPADASPVIAANPCPDVELVEFDQLPAGEISQVEGSCFPAGVWCVAPTYASVIFNGGTYWCAFLPEPTPVPTTAPIPLPTVIGSASAPIPEFTG